MKLEILSLPVPAPGETIDDDALTEAVGAADIKSFDSHVIHGAGGPRLVLVLGLAAATQRVRTPEPTLTGDDRDLFDGLRAWRNGFAQSRGLAPYLVLSNRTLAAVATTRPREIDALLTLPGIGEAKAALYGAELLLQLEGLEADLGRIMAANDADANAAPTQVITGSA